MNARRLILPAALAALATLGLAGCGEKPQQLSASKSRGPDAQPWRGTEGRFADGGWKAGDANSWEEHLRSRAQRGQNEYSRAPAQP